MTSESEAVPHKRQSGQFGVGEFLHSSRLRGRTPNSLETNGLKQEEGRSSLVAAPGARQAGPRERCGSELGPGGGWEGELDKDHNSESKVASGLFRDLEGICK